MFGTRPTLTSLVCCSSCFCWPRIVSFARRLSCCHIKGILCVRPQSAIPVKPPSALPAYTIAAGYAGIAVSLVGTPTTALAAPTCLLRPLCRPAAGATSAAPLSLRRPDRPSVFKLRQVLHLRPQPQYWPSGSACCWVVIVLSGRERIPPGRRRSSAGGALLAHAAHPGVYCSGAAPIRRRCANHSLERIRRADRTHTSR